MSLMALSVDAGVSEKGFVSARRGKRRQKSLKNPPTANETFCILHLLLLLFVCTSVKINFISTSPPIHYRCKAILTHAKLHT